jgi:hypothetical protein
VDVFARAMLALTMRVASSGSGNIQALIAHPCTTTPTMGTALEGGASLPMALDPPVDEPMILPFHMPGNCAGHFTVSSAP